jgi:hypothetical protein
METAQMSDITDEICHPPLPSWNKYIDKLDGSHKDTKNFMDVAGNQMKMYANYYVYNQG